MSLLMDALKKAEEAKKTHKPPHEEAPPAEGVQEWPSAETALTHDEVFIEESQEIELQQPFVEERAPTLPQTWDEPQNSWDEQWLPEFATAEKTSSQALAEETEKVTDFSLREWRHVEEEPAEKPAENPQNHAFLEPSPLAPELPEPTQETPAAAQRILTASAPPTSYRTTLLYGILVIVVASLGGGYYYYQTLMSNQSPFLVVQPLHRPTIGEPLPPLPSRPQAVPRKEVAAKVEEKMPATLSNQPPPENNKPVPVTTAANSSATDIKEQSPPPPPPKKEMTPANNQTAAVAPPEKPSPLAVPEEIRLRKTMTQQLNTELSKGYVAFLRGDNHTAQRAYRDTLEKDQNNRDALLGLAAIAMRQGQTSVARRYYQQILQLYPQDVPAQVGLMTTQPSVGSESQLKLLLEHSPQSSYIHFNLGNLYAIQGRWALAQQAYFEAYRHDSSQADYAYNLAVSLDQLNQPTTALSYYQKALQLAKNQIINFNLSAVHRRIQTLLNYRRPAALTSLPMRANE